MKTKVLTTVIMAGMLSGCSSSFFLASNTNGEDDVYFNPEKQYVASANGNEVNPVNAKDPRIAELQRKMNASLSDSVASADTVYVEEEYKNPYDAVLANSYAESRERRLKAQSELGFNYSAYSDALWYASAYDPAFYNVVIYGSSVWVEPRWVTSSWYFPRSSFSMNFGFGYGAYWPGYSFGYGVYNPWYVGYGYPWYSNYYGYGYYGHDYDYGYCNHGRPANSSNYYYGSRSGSGTNYGSRSGVVNSGNLRGIAVPTERREVRSSSLDPSGDGGRITRDVRSAGNSAGEVSTGNRRPGSGASNSYTRPANNYTRPSSSEGGRGSSYTPVYNRPSSGVRQEYNRPASSNSSDNYRRPESSNSSDSYRRSYNSSSPASNGNSSSYSRPSNTSSGSNSSGNVRRR